jgi:hypothetical protein
MNDNLKSLQGLLKVFNTDRIVSPDDVTAVLAGIAKLLANFKKNNDKLSAANKAQVDSLVAQVAEAQTKLEQELRQHVQNSQSKLATDVQTHTAQMLHKAQSLVAEAKAAMPRDGRDADPAAVVPLVLEQIKLPENKQYVLSGEDILNALDQLPDEARIDAKRIKNLPQPVYQGGGAPRPRIYTYDLSSQCNGTTKTFNLPFNFGILGLYCTQAPIIYRPLIDYTATDRTLTLGSGVDAPQTGQTLVVQYTR